MSERDELREKIVDILRVAAAIGPHAVEGEGRLVELLDLRAENARLRERCTWLQERRAVLRKLLAAKWSKRKEVRAMRAKLAAGPVMPEVPQSELVLDELSRVMSWERAIEMYADIRTALLKEQSR